MNNNDDQIFLDFNKPPRFSSRSIRTNLRDNKMQETVTALFDESSAFRCYSGYTSLHKIIDIFGKKWNNKRLELLFGNEDVYAEFLPELERRLVYFKNNIEKFWKKEHLSILQVPQVVNLIDHINSGRLSVKIHPSFHGKIYRGNGTTIVGSSNCTYNGLVSQRECNVLVPHREAKARDLDQYADIIWNEAFDYTGGLKAILEDLLSLTTWEEALAQGLLTILEGSWLAEYPDITGGLRRDRLWPSQIKSIGQSLYVLDNYGSVLLADATGSGKTRMIAALQAILVNRRWSEGKMDRSNALIICPAVAKDTWQRELHLIASNPAPVLSIGLLGATNLSWANRQFVETSLDRVNLLFLDEVHNFYRKTSGRSRALLRHNADHVVCITATPINKELTDVFRLIEIMDLDNLDEAMIKVFEQLYRSRRFVSTKDIMPLKEAISRVTVRHTKSELNSLVDKHPSSYTDDKGRECRYPAQDNRTYNTEESAHDIEAGRRIEELASQLAGIRYLRTWKNIKRFQLASGRSIAEIVGTRLKSGQALCAYQVMAALRSSKARLLEHVYGTRAAMELCGIDGPAENENKSVIESLKKDSRDLPESPPDIELPEWLCDKDLYREKCEKEIACYEQIGALAKQLEASRELHKAELLLSVIARHKLVLAYDSYIISLQYFSHILKDKGHGKTVLMTGKAGSRRKGERLFGLDAPESGWIGLCSDAVSESVNLQGSSAIVLLDLPSVIRICEQRIGRIDRMNSPYPEIEIYWPVDHPVFSLKKDIRLFRAYEAVDAIFGSNIRIPEAVYHEGFNSAKPDIIDGKKAIEIYQKRRQEQEYNYLFQEGLSDALMPLKSLLSGSKSIIDTPLVETISDNLDRLPSSACAFVHSKKPFAVCIYRFSHRHAPRIVCIDENNTVITKLDEVAVFIRQHCGGSLSWQTVPKTGDRVLSRFLYVLERNRKTLLPSKLRRALGLFSAVLKDYLKGSDIRSDRLDVIRFLLTVLQGKTPNASVDYAQLAEKVLDVLRPYRAEYMNTYPRRLFMLKRLRPYLQERPLSNVELQAVADSVTFLPEIGRRVSMSIVGIPG